MSLTSLMNRADVRARMAREFPKPALCVHGSILALPIGEHPGLVGTAVDYLLRFFCEHKNPSATKQRLVAHAARKHLDSFAPSPRVVQLVDAALLEAEAHQAHIRATGLITRSAVENALALAQLDSVARTLHYDESWFAPPALADVDDVAAICALFAAQRWLTATSTCLLNPMFASVPREIGTADADLVIDDMIIDVKTNIRLDLTRETFNQLLGYAMLERRQGFRDEPARRPPLRRIGVYFARHGLLADWTLEEVVDAEALGAFFSGPWVKS